MKILVVDDPQQFSREPWNRATQRRFELDSADVETLEEGQTLLRADIGFYLDDDEEMTDVLNCHE